MTHLMRSIGGTLACALALGSGVGATPGPTYGVYLRLADGPAGSYHAMLEAMPALAERAGMPLLATLPVATGGCRFQATVFVLQSPAWAGQVTAAGRHGAFAAPIRLAVFEDEAGTHLALANPQSLARTIVGEDFDGPAGEVVAALTAAVRAGFPGTPVAEPYGQLRDRGLIGKTMGIVAGGPFPSKVEEVARVKATAALNLEALTLAIAEVGRRPTTRWGLRLAYHTPLPDGAELLGFTGAAMEARSFAIVGAGGNPAREGYACAGLDHAPAYPLELLVAREGGDLVVLVTDVMFRMKLYFEDAGTMKFAANMAMPGSIEDELRDRVDEALENLQDRLAAH
ncbi:MAG: hypothetical protein SF070_08500 [Gemmatimonadota bacterium]|nr:hypothetical protein [Gemmatimonadota bacterium]